MTICFAQTNGQFVDNSMQTIGEQQESQPEQRLNAILLNKRPWKRAILSTNFILTPNFVPFYFILFSYEWRRFFKLSLHFCFTILHFSLILSSVSVLLFFFNDTYKIQLAFLLSLCLRWSFNRTGSLMFSPSHWLWSSRRVINENYLKVSFFFGKISSVFRMCASSNLLHFLVLKSWIPLSSLRLITKWNRFPGGKLKSQIFRFQTHVTNGRRLIFNSLLPQWFSRFYYVQSITYILFVLICLHSRFSALSRWMWEKKMLHLVGRQHLVCYRLH